MSNIPRCKLEDNTECTKHCHTHTNAMSDCGSFPNVSLFKQTPQEQHINLKCWILWSRCRLVSIILNGMDITEAIQRAITIAIQRATLSGKASRVKKSETRQLGLHINKKWAMFASLRGARRARLGKESAHSRLTVWAEENRHATSSTTACLKKGPPSCHRNLVYENALALLHCLLYNYPDVIVWIQM